MYLHLGQDTVVRVRDIIGIFDLDNTTISPHTRRTLAAAQREDRVVNVTQELPKTFVVATPPGKKHGADTIYICQLSTGTLKKRSGRE